MQEDRIPKAFISYSWSSDDMVLTLAERLVSDGVDIVLDKWELREGQDKYAFMERCVNDPEISKVLIICDKTYTDKANVRTGGVGDETVIISGEMYGQVNQQKFIPIVAEKDQNGDAYVPTYIKSRIYIDLSEPEQYEDNYEKLLRCIYEKPQHTKPMLGKKPEWLDSSNVNLFPLSDLVRRISGSTALRKQQGCVSHFVQQYVETLKTYRPTKTPSGQEVYEKYVEMKSIRDVFLDFLPALYETELNFAEVICEAFENMYNTLTCAQGFDPNARQACPSDYEIYKIHIWELFICVIVYLRNIQDYAMIHTILTHTFFLVDSCLTSNVKVANYCKFRFHSEMIEEQYKPSTANKSKFTLVGHTLCNEREKRPIYTKESIAEADLFLYQVCNALELSQDDGRYDPYWFPTCYVYAEYSPNEWSKMVSRDYCKKKMFLLFGVDSIEKLKEAISHCTYERDMRYNGCFEAAPSILSLIDLEKIGTVN